MKKDRVRQGRNRRNRQEAAGGKRFRLFRYLFAAAAFLFFSAGFAERYQARDMKIMIGTDLHYISSKLEDGGERFMKLLYEADGKVSQYSEELLDAFLETVIREEPDLLLLTGDLTFNGEKISHEDLAGRLDAVAEAGIRVAVFPGNHDLNNRMARKYTGSTLELTPTVTAAEFAQIYGSFGLQQALYRDPCSYSFIYPLDETHWLACVDVNAEDSPGTLKDETLSWLKPILQKASDDGITVLSATHQNLLVHNTKFNMGFTMGKWEDLLALYETFHVRLNLSGHMHVQHIISKGGVTDIATSCMSSAPCQYGVLTIHEDDSCTYDTCAVDVASRARKQGSGNEELLSFAAYARLFFDTMTRRSAEKALLGVSMDDAVRARLVQEMTRVNRAYFAGRMDLLADGAQILEDWKRNCPDPFLLFYLQSVVGKETEDQNHWKGDLS